MPDTATLRCQACGQGWRLEQADTFNLLTPAFCPICGSAGRLTRAANRAPFKSVLGGTYFVEKAACFDGIDSQLQVLLYQNWRQELKADPTNTAKRFVDYCKEQLA